MISGGFYSTGNPTDLSTSPTFPKSKEVVQIKEPGALTLGDRRLFNHLLAIAYRHLSTRDYHESNIKALIATGHESSDRVKESIERLQRTLVQLHDGRRWMSVQLLGPSQYDETTGVVHYRFLPVTCSPSFIRL